MTENGFTKDREARLDRLWNSIDAFLGSTKPLSRDRITELVARNGSSRELLEILMESPKGPADSKEPESRDPIHDAAAIPDRIGSYRILKVLGHGGMGVVYLAEQEQPIRRRVAIKLIPWGMDTRAIVRRFESERQALALMNHPNIARILDAGATSEGRPYFVMENVPGDPITRYCDRECLPLHDRLRLFTTICHAVQHAHQKGIIHRDLKPSNVLVNREHAEATTKIIDFGISKAIGSASDPHARMTLEGQVIGTPEYMSPEQATGLDIDSRADIYALGVLLHELLAGCLPAGRDLSRIRRDDAIGVDPPLMSQSLQEAKTLADIARRRRRTPQGLVRQLRGDLDWIAAKTLRWDRTLRYSSASELVADIERHLHNEPVTAGPPTAGYRLSKFVRRYRGPLAAAFVVLSVLAVGVVGNVRSAAEARRARRDADDHLQRVLRLSDRKVVDQLLFEATHELWPAMPEKIAELDAWMIEARRLLDRRGQHEDSLRRLLENSERDVGQKALPRFSPGIPLWSPERKTSAPIPSSGWRLAGQENQWQGDLASDLLRRLDELEIAYADVRQRIVLSRRLEELSLTSDDAKWAWEDAVEDIPTLPWYRGVELKPQFGLLPLEPDPITGLWEFCHVQSGEPPERDPETDRWVITEETGIIMVLLPGGAFDMGAEPPRIGRPRGSPNVDADCGPGEGPVTRTKLVPFFCSKYEVTQAQWRRLTGENPSTYGTRGGEVEATARSVLPVESVSWERCRFVLSRAGLTLPSAAEWEYACRAGTATPWNTGESIQSLQGYANISDATRAQGIPESLSAFYYDAGIHDGYLLCAPVGSFEPNDFGLFDTHGNVWEWCLDELSGPESMDYACRGGSFAQRAFFARCTAFSTRLKDNATEDTGARPVRPILDM